MLRVEDLDLGQEGAEIILLDANPTARKGPSVSVARKVHPVE